MERRCAMFAMMLVLGLIAAASLVAGTVQFRRDGYHRTPTRTA